MPIKRVVKKTAVKRKSSTGSTGSTGNIGNTDSTGSLVLPTKPREVSLNLNDYCLLIYGRPGIGKTTALASFPGILCCSTERITKGVSLYDYNSDGGGCKTWEQFLAMIELLEKEDHPFTMVGIDSADTLYDICMTYVCKRLQINHPGDENDYGYSWSEVKHEFDTGLRRLVSLGLGVVLTSHSKEETITQFSGKKFTRIRPTLSGQAYEVIKKITDIVLYCEYMKAMDGEDIRIVQCVGDELVDAKNNVGLPKYTLLTREGFSDRLQNGIDGKAIEIEPDSFFPSKQTSNTFKTSLGLEKGRQAKAKMKQKR